MCVRSDVGTPSLLLLPLLLQLLHSPPPCQLLSLSHFSPSSHLPPLSPLPLLIFLLSLPLIFLPLIFLLSLPSGLPLIILPPPPPAAIQQRMLLGPKRDLFRLRKQNTSRPPSMHVDDFMASKVLIGLHSTF